MIKQENRKEARKIEGAKLGVAKWREIDRAEEGLNYWLSKNVCMILPEISLKLI